MSSLRSKPAEIKAPESNGQHDQEYIEPQPRYHNWEQASPTGSISLPRSALFWGVKDMRMYHFYRRHLRTFGLATDMNRRQALAALGTTALTSVTGCATLEAELGMRADTLGAITLANSIADPFKVSLEVLRDSTLVHQASYQLDPGSEQERPQYTINEWKENPDARRWTVRAKIPESEWRDATIDAVRGSEDECYSVAVVTGDWPETPLLVLLGGCESDNH